MAKTLRDYITESEAWISSPAVGDDFSINIREECLIESHIVDVTEDGIVIEADDRMMQILESYGLLEEGIGQAVRRGVKNLRRGMQGWGGTQDTPQQIVQRNRAHSDQDVLDLRKGPDPVSGSPQALQSRVLDREIKKRWGMDETSDPYRREISPPSAEEFEEGVSESEQSSAVDVDAVLAILRQTLSRLSSEGGWSNEAQGQFEDVYRHTRRSLMQGDWPAAKDYLQSVGATNPDLFDAFTGAMWEVADLPNNATWEEFEQAMSGSLEEGSEAHVKKIYQAIKNTKQERADWIRRGLDVSSLDRELDDLEAQLKDAEDRWQETDRPSDQTEIQRLRELAGMPPASMPAVNEFDTSDFGDRYTLYASGGEVGKYSSVEDAQEEIDWAMNARPDEARKTIWTIKDETTGKTVYEVDPFDIPKPGKFGFMGKPISGLGPLLKEGGVKNWVDDLYYEFQERHNLPHDIDDDAFLDIAHKFLSREGIDPEKIEDIAELFLDMRDHEEDADLHRSNDPYDIDDPAPMEAKYQGREVPLGKPMAGDVKKSKVYVKGPKGNVVKVNFGDKTMRIKKSNPKRRKNFRARHNCANPGPRWRARYWSCRAW